MQASANMGGKVALVTGAAAGLGAASALKLAGAGADLALVDRDAEGLARTAEAVRAMGRAALELPLDLADRPNCAQAVERALGEFGRLDALCNVAGVMKPGRTPDYDEAAWDLTMKVNLEAPFFLIRAALPALLEAEGAVVNVTSCAAFKGQAYFAAYCATKAALTNMTKALAMEFAKEPIRINAVAPGGMMTGMVAGMAALEGCDQDLIGRIGSARGMNEIEDVADCVAFLASPAARGYHGACISIDAGTTAG
ncbi:short-chain dehydrogenase [Novosphingobium sp. PC22D]|uniref:SDR family NAD(P)-dependent oxidoreductase n=1 Tax=Novosphingobium sp. PC22D TaxID=1962403 RepID=UPI000BF15D7E|nr:SDR family oxidoreductase [Novosphingobium sp. PC22D]PEQ14246.1 short-chain dehydrogenase [Novosphingobium sp. PC22D]